MNVYDLIRNNACLRTTESKPLNVFSFYSNGGAQSDSYYYFIQNVFSR